MSTDGRNNWKWFVRDVRACEEITASAKKGFTLRDSQPLQYQKWVSARMNLFDKLFSYISAFHWWCQKCVNCIHATTSHSCEYILHCVMHKLASSNVNVSQQAARKRVDNGSEYERGKYLGLHFRFWEIMHHNWLIPFDLWFRTEQLRTWFLWNSVDNQHAVVGFRYMHINS